MAEAVKRRYDSTRRREQAEQTRLQILEAAQRLFERDGYAMTPVSDRDWYRSVVDERDLERKLHLLTSQSRAVKERAAPVMEVIRRGADADPDVAQLWDRIQGNFHEIQHGIAATLPLRRGMSVDEAADILWALNNADTWQLLVVRRGWTPEQWERWFDASIRAQLL